MRQLILPALILGCGLMAARISAAADKPQQVQDLEYGEILFHFYQDDYYTAISKLMVAQKKQQLHHHKEEGELLLGGLQLSYGMRNHAEKQFLLVLDQSTDADTRNRAWYYLTRIAYQQGDYAQALRALERIDKTGSRDENARLALLKATIQMEQGNNREAAKSLENVKAGEDILPYVQINRGIALLRNGDIEAGQKVLDKLGRNNPADSELTALTDQANLGLGYQLLREGNAKDASRFLGRVRLEGSQSNAALLGAGWAEIQQDNYRQALTPWLELQSRASFDAPVQEAHLAVPYAFTRLGDTKRAIQYYEASIDYFRYEESRLELAVESVRSGEFVQMLAQLDTSSDSGGWLHHPPTLENVPAGRYLTELLSSHAFQEGLKDYRDLGYLYRQLEQRRQDIHLFHDMVEARRLAYKQRSPLISNRLQENEAGELSQHWLHIKQQLAKQDSSPDPMGLATGKELQQLKILKQVHETLNGIPDEPRYREMAERTEWLQGVLYWQVQADYKQRLWDTKSALKSTGDAIQIAIDNHRRVEQLLDNMRAGFEGYDRRIKKLEQRINDTLQAITAVRSATGKQLRELSLSALEQRRKRLESYRSQARYALARSYDLLAQRAEMQP